MEEDRLQSLLRRIDASEQRVAKLSEEWQSRKNDPAYSDGVRKVQADLRKRLVFSYQFSYVPSNYYDMDLEQRATLLKASAPQLCKSILFENTVWEGDDEFDPTNARYYCVIVQYVGKFLIRFSKPLVANVLNYNSQNQYTVSQESYSFPKIIHKKAIQE